MDKDIQDLHEMARELGKRHAKMAELKEGTGLTTERKKEILQSLPLNEMVNSIVSIFENYAPIDVGSIPNYTHKVFKENETKILSILINQSHTHSQEEIAYILGHYCAYLGAMSSICGQAVLLDLD